MNQSRGGGVHDKERRKSGEMRKRKEKEASERKHGNYGVQ